MFSKYRKELHRLLHNLTASCDYLCVHFIKSRGCLNLKHIGKHVFFMMVTSKVIMLGQVASWKSQLQQMMCLHNHYATSETSTSESDFSSAGCTLSCCCTMRLITGVRERGQLFKGVSNHWDVCWAAVSQKVWATKLKSFQSHKHGPGLSLNAAVWVMLREFLIQTERWHTRRSECVFVHMWE